MTGDLIAAQSPIYALEQARHKLTVRQMLARNPKSTPEASGPEVGASLIEHGHVSQEKKPLLSHHGCRVGMKPSLTLACNKRNFVMAASRWGKRKWDYPSRLHHGLGTSVVYIRSLLLLYRMRGGCGQNTRHNGVS